MRVIVQRVKQASVSIDETVIGEIKQGFLLLVGFTTTDQFETVEKMVQKIINLRIFDDENGKMNLALADVGGAILSISQFTLYADYKKGNRPSFTNAAEYPKANELYAHFNRLLAQTCLVETGEFGAYMQVALVNDGPVTLILDSLDLS